ncbi:hypothetical protein E4U44_002991 [Claviceps purpurea]|nr:hypothetical protein E4U44_002991 [Claviceps purpurea]
MGSEDKSDSPQTNTGKHWTLEEHDLLLALKGAGETWQDISERLERTPQACQDHYLQAKLGTKWTEEEDKLLFTLKEAGEKWQEISESLGRTCEGCRRRYYEKRVELPETGSFQGSLQLKLEKRRWTAAEEKLLFQLKVSDKTWQEISDHLPGRTVNSCRAHYNVVLHRGWGHEEENKLARLYESRKAENEMSAKIGQELKLPWEEAEEMHWRLGAEGMAKRAGAANLSPAPRQPVQTTDEQFANGSRLAMSEDELMACMAELLDETAFAPSNDLESSNEYGS